MSHKEPTFFMRSKIWIEDRDGNMIFGLGRYRILEAVNRLGSLHAASKELKMSYRGVWCKIKVSEERIGKPLLIRGKKGSTITPVAEKLMKQFRRIQSIVESESNEMYQDLMQRELDNR